MSRLTVLRSTSHITFQKSYLARLRYVHYNPAHHGVVPLAENYK